jgi:uncharacterized protein YuzE
VKLTFDPDSDTLRIDLREGEVAESDEARSGVILDFDAAGNVLSIEILDASTRVQDPREVQFRAAV